jgi:hypothetical protein
VASLKTTAVSCPRQQHGMIAIERGMWIPIASASSAFDCHFAELVAKKIEEND